MAKIGINASFVRKANTGIGQVTLNFLHELIRGNSEHDFILYLEEDLPKEIVLPANFKTRVFLPPWRRDDLIRKIWWEKYLLPQKVAEDRCEAFISLYQSPTILEYTKHLVVVHDIIPKLFPEYLNNWRKVWYWKLTEEAIAKANRIITVSKRSEKDLAEYLGIDPTKIATAYIDVDEIYKKNVTAEKTAEVLRKYHLKPGYIYNGGGLEKRKNAEGVLRAYKFLLEKNKKENLVHDFPKLVISGKLLPQLAPLIVDVEKLVHELNLTEHVQILDFVPQADLPALYASATMFVYPSHYEGFGLPVLEAMAVGTPVVTAKTSSLPEVGGDSVVYCNADDVQDLALTMKNVLLNKDLRDALSRRGQERAQRFSWESFVKKVMNILAE